MSVEALSGVNFSAAVEPEMQPQPMMEARRPGGGNGARANPLGRGTGSLPQLTGIAQVVGLALGSPEFQRR